MSHVKIPKTQIQLNVWTIGRDPNRWTDPEDFIPERFTNTCVDFRRQNFELVPFGSGRRICPGMPMAIATMELGLLNLLDFFDWQLSEVMVKGDDIDMEEAGNFTIVKKLVPVQRY
ncbi:Cytochrome P450 71B2 [Cardamine amara subsp. amara]|uniref:Cytochrome P450 71B2 n=1 Tax=Cardamine amara subsp. amara TaxID=228776 RepID=A0ABD1B196_CARAN